MKSLFRRPASASPLLLLLLMPFVLAFDYPDDPGYHAKVSGGRGTYSLSSCSRSYQSESMEENVDISATFPTGSDGTHPRSKLWPEKTTVGAYGNLAQEKLTLVKEEDGSVVTNPGPPHNDQGISAGVYSQFDWRIVGLQIGGIYLSRWNLEEGKHGNKLLPTGELRLGPEYLFASASLLSSTPIQSGGEGLNWGIGGRLENTRIWAGLASYPSEDYCLVLKASQKLGPIKLSFAGELTPPRSSPKPYEDTYPNHAFSLGVEFPLARAW